MPTCCRHTRSRRVHRPAPRTQALATAASSATARASGQVVTACRLVETSPRFWRAVRREHAEARRPSQNSAGRNAQRPRQPADVDAAMPPGRSHCACAGSASRIIESYFVGRRRVQKATAASRLAAPPGRHVDQHRSQCIDDHASDDVGPDAARSFQALMTVRTSARRRSHEENGSNSAMLGNGSTRPCRSAARPCRAHRLGISTAVRRRGSCRVACAGATAGGRRRARSRAPRPLRRRWHAGMRGLARCAAAVGALSSTAALANRRMTRPSTPQRMVTTRTLSASRTSRPCR